MQSRKLWKWTLSGRTYIRMGIAFASEPDEILRMLEKEGFTCENFYVEVINQNENLHIISETYTNISHL